MNGASWRFSVDGARATATNSPPGAITETRRVWFELKLEKRGEARTCGPSADKTKAPLARSERGSSFPES